MLPYGLNIPVTVLQTEAIIITRFQRKQCDPFDVLIDAQDRAGAVARGIIVAQHRRRHAGCVQQLLHFLAVGIVEK